MLRSAIAGARVVVGDKLEAQQSVLEAQTECRDLWVWLEGGKGGKGGARGECERLRGELEGEWSND